MSLAFFIENQETQGTVKNQRMKQAKYERIIPTNLVENKNYANLCVRQGQQTTARA